MRSQPASIGWTRTSTADLIIAEVTQNILFYELDVLLHMFDINIVCLIRYANLFDFWFNKRQQYVIFTHAWFCLFNFGLRKFDIVLFLSTLILKKVDNL